MKIRELTEYLRGWYSLPRERACFYSPGKTAYKSFFWALFLSSLLTVGSVSGLSTVRIKDIASFQGVRGNQLVGYGLVVGLKGTGDKSSPFTNESLVSMLEQMGVNVRDIMTSGSKNVAAVMVTATLPPFARQGTEIDVVVSAIGDAKDLLGGSLLPAPLLGADGTVYAVAQGSLAVGGYDIKGKGASVSKGVPTSARISNGAIVEKEISYDLNSQETTRISLRNPDFTTATRVVDVINAHIKTPVATLSDASTIDIKVPEKFQNKMAALITEIEQLSIVPDQPARIVIDEQSGVVVMGSHVRISTVAISQGNLVIRISENPQVSQPGPLSTGGQTKIVQRTNVQVDTEGTEKITVMPAGASLQDVVNGLNNLGVGPRDIISILHSIKSAGALQADIEVI